MDMHGNMPLIPDAEVAPCSWCCSCAADAESIWLAAAARLLALGMRLRNSWKAASESFLGMPPFVAVPPSLHSPPTRSSTLKTLAIAPVASFILATRHVNAYVDWYHTWLHALAKGRSMARFGASDFAIVYFSPNQTCTHVSKMPV